MRVARARSESGYYHVVMRGNGRQVLFEDATDRDSFLAMLCEQASCHGVRVIAWCLMANHVHLVLDDADGRLSEMMRALATAYAQRFNCRAGRVGHVFQGRFHSTPIETESYLLAAVRYVHLNPEKAHVCPAEEYPWSSYREYVGMPRISDTSTILELAGGVEGFAAYTRAGDDGGYRPASRARVPDSQMTTLAAEVLGPLPVSDLKTVEKPLRDALLCELRDAGLSVRQIELLSGLGANSITRATR